MKSIVLSDILGFLDNEKIPYTYNGAQELEVSGFASLANYKKGYFTWIKNEENAAKTKSLSEITLLFCQENVKVSDAPNVIFTSQSKRAFFSVIEHFYSSPIKQDSKIGEGTYISPQVKLGKNVIIGRNCVLDGEITVGDNTEIFHNVSIVNRVKIGMGCTIQSGVVIGHDGFAFTDKGQKIKHFGGVNIGDNVYLGMNTVIEQGTIDATEIGDNCKIDTQCTIGHNSTIEQGCMLVTNTMIYGSVHIGKNSYIASAIIRNQCTIGKNVFVGMGSVVTKNIPEDTTVFGVPARIAKK